MGGVAINVGVQVTREVSNRLGGNSPTDIIVFDRIASVSAAANA